MNCQYLINMEDGRLEFRDEYTETQVNLKPIPDEVKSMIMSGEVTPQDVINAISIKIKESGDFNISQYIEDLKKLNVRQANKQEAPQHVDLPDVQDAISVAEVVAVKDKSGKSTKKERVKKVNEAIDSALPDIFSK